MPGLLPLEVDGAVRVAWLAPGGPAAQAGVQLGDHIESVDGAPCPAAPACLAPEQAPGSAVQLTLRPAAGGPPRTLTLAADQPRVVVTPPIGAAPAMRTLSWSAQLPLASGGHAELLGLSAMSVAAGQRIHDRLGRLQGREGGVAEWHKHEGSDGPRRRGGGLKGGQGPLVALQNRSSQAGPQAHVPATPAISNPRYTGAIMLALPNTTTLQSHCEGPVNSTASVISHINT
jgi:hypothetical protein